LFAEKAVELLCNGQGNKIVGLQNGKIESIDLKETCEKIRPLDMRIMSLAEMLAT
jgi:6-phosphofructokinase